MSEQEPKRLDVVILPSAGEGVLGVIAATVEANDTLTILRDLVHATTVDMFTATVRGHAVDVWVDDEALFVETPAVNPIASALRGYLIFGNVVLAATDDQGETVSLDVDTAADVIDWATREEWAPEWLRVSYEFANAAANPRGGE